MLHTRTYGHPGGLPALLAHCFLGHSGGWKGFVQAMPESLDALAIDMPGHGRSPIPADPGDFHALVSNQITGLVTRPTLLIGHSFGAACALRHALRHPETVLGLVLIEPVYFAVARSEPEFGPYERSEHAMRAGVQAGDLDGAARAFLSLGDDSPDFDTLPGPVRAQMAAQMPLVAATRAGLFDDSGGLLEPGLIEGFDKPVLLMRGGQTTPIFFATVRALAARLPCAEVSVIEEAGHMVPISHPEATAAAVAGWMERNGLAQPEIQKPRVG